MGISKTRSVVTLPDAKPPYPSVLDFLSSAFPHVPRTTWEQRLADGKVLDDNNKPITSRTPYTPARRIFYFREVEDEPVIPLAEKILFQNEEILVACKPHFLPVIPGGRFVNECLLNRLRVRTGIADLTPLHRIDRETAGIVIFSTNRKSRGLYHKLFVQGNMAKTYHAIAGVKPPLTEDHWVVQNRIVRGEPRFRMKTVAGMENSRSLIHLMAVQGDRGNFRLNPITGKTHQLRLHMSGIGFHILNDRLYPNLLSAQQDDFDRPLQLLAKQIRFQDPITGKTVEFTSERALLF